MEAMDSNIKENILRLDRPAPRYTSYPTAPHFRQETGGNTSKIWLESLPRNSSLSLYIHMPFCPKLCWFCGCHTKITKRYAPVEDYLHLLLREIDILTAFGRRDFTISHIHFGGGSPTILRSCDFALLMDKIRDSFDIADNAEIAVEIDPRQMSEAKAAAYAKSGVTRASLGIQDFNQKVLESVNRAQPFYASYETIQLLRDYGISGINIDLMYGLPHQTADTMKEAAENVLLLNPDRLSLFGYAHVPWMKKHMRLIPEQALPNPAARLDLFDIAANIFQTSGYAPIGIDHFAKPGDSLVKAKDSGTLHRNFQGYTTDNATALIGIGASAISRFPQGFTQNSVQMPAYREHILAETLATEKTCPLSDEDRLREEVIQSIMCTLAADTAAICEKNGYARDYFTWEIGTLQPLKDSGLLDYDDAGNINVLVPHAARLACIAFDAYLKQNETAKHVTTT